MKSTMNKNWEKWYELFSKLERSRRSLSRSLTTEKTWTSTNSLGISKLMKWRWRFMERKNLPRRNLAFKATPSSIEEEESSEDSDEDFTMLIWKVGRIFYKKGRQSNFWRERPQERFEKKKEEMGPCYHCKKTGYLIADCLSLQANTSKKLHKKKKVLKATWDE